MKKKFLLGEREIRPIAEGHGACFASDKITVDGYPVRFMYREEPDHDVDSGWRFLSGYEDEAYMGNPEHHGIYDVNTIANYDPSIVPFLEEAPGSAFEKTAESERFERIEDWDEE